MWNFQSRKFQKEETNNEAGRFWISPHTTVILGPSECRAGPVLIVRQGGWTCLQLDLETLLPVAFLPRLTSVFMRKKDPCEQLVTSQALPKDGQWLMASLRTTTEHSWSGHATFSREPSGSSLLQRFTNYIALKTPGRARISEETQDS